MSFSVESELMPQVAEKYGWSKKVAETKIRRAQMMLNLMHPIDAIQFLLGTTHNPVICDGCIFHQTDDHRCHGTRSAVQGEQTNKHCCCADCFVVNELGIN